MHACSDLRFKFTGEDSDVEKVKSFLEDRFETDVDGNDNFDAIVEETYECVWLESIIDLAIEIIKLTPKLGFVLSGVIDTSESAGEYMDYEIRYEDGKLVSRNSCWYLTIDVLGYDSFEQFCEYHDDCCSEDDYQRGIANGGELFILDSGDGDVVTEVPLSDVEEIDIELYGEE